MRMGGFTLTMRDKFNAMQVRAEHQRLQLAVVEAAKSFVSELERNNWDRLVSFRQLCGTVDALIAFEAEHKIGE